MHKFYKFCPCWINKQTLEDWFFGVGICNTAFFAILNILVIIIEMMLPTWLWNTRDVLTLTYSIIITLYALIQLVANGINYLIHREEFFYIRTHVFLFVTGGICVLIYVSTLDNIFDTIGFYLAAISFYILVFLKQGWWQACIEFFSLRRLKSYKTYITDLEDLKEDYSVEDIYEEVSVSRERQLLAPEVFFCCDSEGRDKKYVKEMQTHLEQFRERIEVWNPITISPGTNIKKDMERALSSAAVAVVFISPNLLAKKVMREQLANLLTKAQSHGTIILLLHVAPCLYEGTGLDSFEPVNPPSRSLAILNPGERDKFYTEAVRMIGYRTALLMSR